MTPCMRAAKLAPRLQQIAAASDFEGAFPTQEFEWLREAELLHSQIIRLPATEMLQILWHIGRGNLAVGRLYEGHVNALQLVQWFGDLGQKTRFFGDADVGKLFAVWNTQAQDGISFEQKGDGWQMQGAKTFCSGAGHIERPIVTGHKSDAGWQMAVVRTEVETTRTTIDSSWWQPLGMRASASFKTDFSGTRLQSDDFLGKADDYYLQPAFSGGAIRFCAVQLGGAAALFDETRRFLREMNRTDDQFQQMRIGQMAAQIQSGWQWLQSAGAMWDSLGTSPLDADEEASKRIVAFAAMMRVATEEICVNVMQMAEKSVGARGLLRSEPFERLIRDLTMYLKQPHLDEIPCRVGKFALYSPNRADQLWQPDTFEISNATL